jgi:hypothetical protein
VTQASSSFEITVILLIQPPAFWNYMYVPPHPALSLCSYLLHLFSYLLDPYTHEAFIFPFR